jgi:hypothetical protein
MTCAGGVFTVGLNRRCLRCQKAKDACRIRWHPDATKTYNQAILAFQSWDRAALRGDDTHTKRAWRAFADAEAKWLEILPTMQHNAGRTTGNQATPHKNRGSASGGSSSIVLALPHLQSISCSLENLVDLQCLVRYACVSHTRSILIHLVGRSRQHGRSCR